MFEENRKINGSALNNLLLFHLNVIIVLSLEKKYANNSSNELINDALLSQTKSYLMCAVDLIFSQRTL